MRLSRQHELFRASVRSVLRREVVPFVDEWESARALPLHELAPRLGDAGLLGPTLPQSVGGGGLDLGYSYVWAQELGAVPAGALGMSLSVQTDIASPVLAEHATAALKTKLLPEVVAGRSILAVAVTEPGGGSDLASITTVAERTSPGYVVRGVKAYVTNAPVADYALTLCRTEGRTGLASLTLLVVPLRAPGVTVERLEAKLGNWSCAHGHVTFADVEVPAENLVGAEGGGYDVQTQMFVRERCFLAAFAAAVARRMVTSARAWARERHVLTKPLLDHQAVAFRLAELDAQVELAHTYAGHVYERFAQGGDCVKVSAVAKLTAARVARSVADCHLQLRGAGGYMSDEGAARDFRDVRALSLAGGADEALLHLIAGLDATTTESAGDAPA